MITIKIRQSIIIRNNILFNAVPEIPDGGNLPVTAKERNRNKIIVNIVKIENTMFTNFKLYYVPTY